MLTPSDELDKQLEDLVDDLAVPPSKYEEATTAYGAVGKWLHEDPEFAGCDPIFFPQGSFALGTAIKPTNGGDYDVDSVCLLKLNCSQIDPERLKRAIGRRLGEHGTYSRLLQPEGTRCWTLKYADQSRFHLDVLPAIPDEPHRLQGLGIPTPFAQHALRITHRVRPGQYSDWLFSNPRGYLEWFKDRMRVVYDLRRRALMEKRGDLLPVPEYEVRTPLQQLVQFLKCHRDIVFGDSKDKPISIIVTTVTAEAYQNEPTLFLALSNVLPRILQRFASLHEVPDIRNPVDPQEVFNDKWRESISKYHQFRKWLSELTELFDMIRQAPGIEKRAEIIERTFGRGRGENLLEKYASRQRGSRISALTSAVQAIRQPTRPWSP